MIDKSNIRNLTFYMILIIFKGIHTKTLNFNLSNNAKVSLIKVPKILLLPKKTNKIKKSFQFLIIYKVKLKNHKILISTIKVKRRKSHILPKTTILKTSQTNKKLIKKIWTL